MRTWNSLILLCGLFFASVSLASNAIFTITPSTSAVTLRSDSTTSVIYTVTNNRPVSVSGLTINPGYLTTGRASGLTIQNNNCTGMIISHSTCTFGVLIQGSNQPSTFILRPTVCGSGGQVCANTGASGQLTVTVLQVTAPPYAYLSIYPCVDTASSSGGCFAAPSSQGVPATGNIGVMNTVTHALVARVRGLSIIAPPSNNKLACQHEVASAPSATSVAVSLDGSRVYVAEQPNSHADNNADIAVLSGGATSTLLQRIALPINHASYFFIAVTPDDKTLYVSVTNSCAEDAVYAINLETNVVTPIEGTFATPLAVAISPDGSRAYVANEMGGDSTGSISVINTSTNEIVTTLDSNTAPGAFNFPIQLSVSPDGKTLYVLNSSGLSLQPFYIANSYSAEAVIPLEDYASSVLGLTLSQDGNTAYVSALDNSSEPTLLQVDLVSSVTMPISGFTAIHGGLALTPDQSALWMVPGLGVGKTNMPSLSRLSPASEVEIVTGLLTSPIVTPLAPPTQEDTFLIQYGAFIN